MMATPIISEDFGKEEFNFKLKMPENMESLLTPMA
jgi:hypothetical protein